MFFIVERSEEITFEFSQNYATIVWFLLHITIETQKIANLLGDSLKFATRKLYVINDQNNAVYGAGNENGTTVKFETQVIKSNVYDYSDAYILVTGEITAMGGDDNTKVAFKNCARFTKCITHINDKHVDTADYLDIVMPMYNLAEYSGNYSDISGSWEESPVTNAGNPDNVSVNNSSSFKYKSSLIGDSAAVAGNRVVKNVKNSCSTKISEQFLEIFRNAID